MDSIQISFNKYILEFHDISEDDKDKIIDGVDKSPAQNISYQLGWLSLLLEWEKLEKNHIHVFMPKEGFKWNNLGGLYQEFYETYQNYSLKEMQELLLSRVNEVLIWIETLDDNELFLLDQRQWAETPAKWPVYKWIHINTVAPFTNFRTKIRKWKKLNSNLQLS